MIKRTRLNFVLVTMVLVFLIIGVFIGSTIIINYNTSRNETYMRLSMSVKNDQISTATATPPNFDPRTVTLVCLYDSNGSLASVSVSGQNNIFSTQQDAESFVNKVVVNGKIVARKDDKGSYRGTLNNIYYVADSKIVGEMYQVTIAVADRSVEESMLTRTTLTLISVSSAALIVVFVVVWFLSYKVVKPVEVAFNKQKQFISDASHELKTPVTIIRANVEALESEGASSEWSQNILSQTDRLTTLVNEMLNLAKIEERPVVKEHVDVSAVVEATTLEFEPLAYEQHKKFTCNVQSDLTLTSSSDEIRRVTMLLVDNAVKYSDTYLSVNLSKIGKTIKLRVVNDGCQVAEENKEKIFQRFYRQDTSRTRETGGNGLGLATVKAICEKNKWKIAVDCSVGGEMDISIDLQ